MRLRRSERLSSPAARAARHAYAAVGAVHHGLAKALPWGLERLAAHLGRLPWTVRLGLLALVQAEVLILASETGWTWWLAWADPTAAQRDALAAMGFVGMVETFQAFAFGAGLVLGAGALLAFVRVRVSLIVLRVGAALYGALMLFALLLLLRMPGYLHGLQESPLDKYVRNDLWLQSGWLWAALMTPWALFLVCVSLRRVRAVYGGRADAGWGDRVVADLRRGGRDPVYRTSLYYAVFAHVFVLFLYPLLLRGCGMEQAYAIPKGSGETKPQVVQVKRIKKKKKYLFDMESPIIFRVPDLDDSEILEEMEDMTEHQYVASTLQSLGQGGPGDGGWPGGMENARVRFLRLEYGGGDWDQDMGKDADYNVLKQFHRLTGFQIAPETESIGIMRLRRFPEHRAPPFVYITGSNGIRASREEIRTLRWYCLEEGGMIFADNGGGGFNRSFRSLMRQVFPKKTFVDIANDDILFRQPYIFPNGAPRLWHHSGDRALGIKHEGRWVVFYHQGDIGDAWKTGHSGISESEAMQSYKLAVNIIHYAFTQYLQRHFAKGKQE
ncbi:MAG: DUF4159 domain-containing protein [Planctomycetota bacterium]